VANVVEADCMIKLINEHSLDVAHTTLKVRAFRHHLRFLGCSVKNTSRYIVEKLL
jgi:hypothetical protein